MKIAEKYKILILENKYFFLFLIFYTIVLILSRYGVVSSGDSVRNIEQIEKYDVLSRSSHFTLHFFGVAYYLVLGNLFNMSSIASIELMLIGFSILGLFSLYFIVLDVSNSKNLSLMAVIFYSFSSGIWRFSIQSEYLILVPSIVLISVIFFIKGQNIISGFFFALGLAVSPFVFLMIPLFFLKEQSVKMYTVKFRNMIIGFVLVYLIVSFFTFSETVTGKWSLMDSLSRFIVTSQFLKGLIILFYGLIRSYNIMLIFFVLGSILLFKQNKRIFWVLVLTMIMHFPTTLSEARQGAYYLGAYPIISMAIAYSVIRIFEIRKYVVLLLIPLFVSANIYVVLAERNHFVNLADTFNRMNEYFSNNDNTIVLVYPSRMPINYYKKNQNFETETIESFVPNEFSKGLDIKEMFNNYKNVYLIESGIRIPDDNMKNLIPGIILKKFDFRHKEYGKEIILKNLPNKQFLKVDGFKDNIYKVD